MSSYIYENNNSKSFYMMAWVAFVCSVAGMVAGLLYLTADLSVKGFFLMTYLFTVSSCFTLAKVTRDKHEADKFINKIENAKTEKFLNDSNPVK